MQKSNNESYIQKNGYQEQMKVLLNNSIELQIRKFELNAKSLMLILGLIEGEHWNRVSGCPTLNNTVGGPLQNIC